MAKLIYSAITSLDEYVADERGKFDWAMPSEEVHAFVNELESRIATYLYGRRMYEVMKYWETAPTTGNEPQVMRDYARVWQSAEKVVYSRSLDAVTTKKTRLEHRFDPEAVRTIKASAMRDVSIGGATLAGAAIAAGLVDEVHLLMTPVLVGGGTRALPSGVRVRLELLNERRFANGVLYAHYRVGESL
jgi:dihydrofolate reductase